VIGEEKRFGEGVEVNRDGLVWGYSPGIFLEEQKKCP
jgi:hypothetical protein